MKIESRKITSTPKKFTLHLKDENCDVNIEGTFYKLSNGLVKIDSRINGDLKLICDLSGDEFIKNLNEGLILFAKDGIWENHANEEEFDVIEFFDGYIDLEFIFKSELESIQLDYHIK